MALENHSSNGFTGQDLEDLLPDRLEDGLGWLRQFGLVAVLQAAHLVQ